MRISLDHTEFMEPLNEPVLNRNPQIQSVSPRSSFPKFLVVSILMLIVGIGIGYLIPTKLLLAPKSETSMSLTPTPTLSSSAPNSAIPTETSAQDTITWVRTKTLVSFVYPYGWHVAELWPNSGGEGIRTEINKGPISTAPRDGGFSDISFTYLNGLPNAEAQLQNKIATAKKDMKVLEEKEIQGEQVKIKYIKFYI